MGLFSSFSSFGGSAVSNLGKDGGYDGNELDDGTHQITFHTFLDGY
jgi:hypothetical protein